MSKSKASRSRARDAKHVRLYLYVLKSDAWLSLSCPARCLMIELQALYNGTNNGELFMSVRSAATLLNTGTKQATAAFRELEDRGFIRATRKGTRTRRGETRLATCWRLTEYDDDLTGRSPTKDFVRWRQGEKNSTVVPETTHRGPRDHGQAAADVSDITDRGPRDYGQAAFEAPTVVSGTTQLINQDREPEKTEPESRAALPRKSGGRSNGIYAGKPTLRSRALDLLREHGSITRAIVVSSFGCNPGEAQRALGQLVERGLAEKVRHGIYRAVGRA